MCVALIGSTHGRSISGLIPGIVSILYSIAARRWLKGGGGGGGDGHLYCKDTSEVNTRSSVCGLEALTQI